MSKCLKDASKLFTTNLCHQQQKEGRHDHMVVGFTTTYSVYHHLSCEFESHSWWGVLHTTLCDKDKSQCLVAGCWFSPGPPVSSTNKTDRYDITEILLKVAFSTIKQTNNQNILAECQVPIKSYNFL